MARRTDIPPYEIMRQRGADNKAAAPQPAAAPSEPAAVSSHGPSPWWVGATVPIVLRIPRGLAVLSIAGLLLLLVLAYWVGASRGRSAAEARLADQQAEAAVLGPRGVGEVSISRQPPESSGSGGDAGPGAGPEEIIRTTYEERRQPGLYYFRLVRTSPEEAEEIAVFLALAQIDTQLYLVDNDELCYVYAVERGFRSDERNSDARRRHESDLRDLGNVWKAKAPGNSNFETMTLFLYEGTGAD